MKKPSLQSDVIWIIFMFAHMAQFIHIAPWIGAEPIESFPASELKNIEIPNGTQSYAVNHGSYMFFERGTIEQEPLKFAITAVIFLLTFLAFCFIMRKIDKGYILTYAIKLKKLLNFQ